MSLVLQPSPAQRFEGPSVEDALGAAVRALGAGLRVREAKRVRRGGMLGFFAREHYEVIAEPGSILDLTAAAPPAGALPGPLAVGDDPVVRVDAALRALVEEVEAREEPPPPSQAPPAAPPALPAAPQRFSDVDLAPLEPAPATLYDFEVLDAEPAGDVPRWTRKALRELGLPAAVLRSLPQRPPTSDATWTRALERAIARHVPAPVVPGGEAPVQVTGRGEAAAIQMVRAGVAGYPPGLLHLEDESVPATAAVLAQAIRSCLPR